MKKIAAFAVAATASTLAAAADPTSIPELTAGISFAVVTTGILAVAAALIPVLITKKGAKIVMGFIGR
jgi:hypothetical protein